MQIGALPHKQPVRFSLIVNQTVQEKMCRVLELADLGGLAVGSTAGRVVESAMVRSNA